MPTIKRHNDLRASGIVTSQLGRSRNRRRALLPLAACSSLVICAPPAAAAPAPVVSGSHGTVTLDRIAGGGISLDPRRSSEMRSFEFRFPPGAQQGPRTWYTIHLDVAVTFTAGTGPGSVLVSASTNGAAAAQVEFYPARSLGGDPFTTWDSVDIFNGDRRGRVKGHRAHVSYENVLQFSGVKAGLSILTFEAEHFGEADVAAIEIGPKSGVYATLDGPVELDIDGGFAQGSLDVGEAGDLAVKVSNTSPRPTRDVEVKVQPHSDRLFVKGPVARHIDELDGATTVHFTVGRTKPGRLGVLAKAITPNGEEASAVLSTEVQPRESGAPWTIAAVIALLAVVGAALIRHHNQQEAGK
jgi:hypothetical protein